MLWLLLWLWSSRHHSIDATSSRHSNNSGRCRRVARAGSYSTCTRERPCPIQNIELIKDRSNREVSIRVLITTNMVLRVPALTSSLLKSASLRLTSLPRSFITERRAKPSDLIVVPFESLICSCFILSRFTF